MAEETKSQLSEDEKIERRAHLFRMFSRILIGVSVVVIGIFIYFAMGTRENIQLQTSLDTEPMRSKLKLIISLENRYFEENGEYVPFRYLQISKELPRYDPDVDNSFKYQFDAQTLIATGREKDATNDVNGDNDGNDGLTLSVNWEADVLEGLSGGNFFWTDEDLADFERRKAE